MTTHFPTPRRAFYGFCAVWLVVLVVVPFTPPFQTWGPNGLLGEVPAHNSLTGDKDTKATAPLVAFRLVSPVAAGGAEPEALACSTPVSRSILTVLRL